MTPDPSQRRPADLPAWFPAWASQLADLYFSGTTAAFVLHGNTYDLFRIGGDEGSRYGTLAEFLAEQLFGRWSLVLHYDLGRGLRSFAGRDEQRLKDMVTLANKKLGDLSALPKDPPATFALVDRFVRNNIMAAEDDRLSLAVIIDQASYVPAGGPGAYTQASSQCDHAQLAMSPHGNAEHGVRDDRLELADVTIVTGIHTSRLSKYRWDQPPAKRSSKPRLRTSPQDFQTSMPRNLATLTPAFR